MYIVTTYVTYLVLSLFLTVWVAQTLFKNGRIFLVDVFHGNEPLADAVNHLLLVGFYLINLGFVCRMLKIDGYVIDPREMIETLTSKMGIVMLALGGMHFLNLIIFGQLRKAAINAVNAPTTDKLTAEGW